MIHTPVLLHEVLEIMDVKPQGKYIDATCGEAGYTVEILKLGGMVLGIDWDEEQIRNISTLVTDNNLKLIQGNFSELEVIATKHGFYPADGIIFDLGLSMRQLNMSGRGLSFNKTNEPLDMRINPEDEITAEYYINTLSNTDLYELFAKYSEEINSRAIADSIVSARKIKKITRVGQLVNVIDKTIGSRDARVLSRIFQALRIAVNREFDNLKNGLAGAAKVIKPNGKIIVVTFHSLEDRIVKQFVLKNKLKFINKKPITANGTNRFERSAKLRAITI